MRSKQLAKSDPIMLQACWGVSTCNQQLSRVLIKQSPSRVVKWYWIPKSQVVTVGDTRSLTNAQHNCGLPQSHSPEHSQQVHQQDPPGKRSWNKHGTKKLSHDGWWYQIVGKCSKQLWMASVALSGGSSPSSPASSYGKRKLKQLWESSD